MLIDLDVHRVAVRPFVLRPHVLLPEAHAIERLRGKPVAHLRELLRVRKAAAQALDLADAAADVERRADVAERSRSAHSHFLAPLEKNARRGIFRRELRCQLRGLHRLSTSSILRPSSSVLITPRWMSVCVSA